MGADHGRNNRPVTVGRFVFTPEGDGIARGMVGSSVMIQG